ncbi:hypothetical protein LguiA_027254 [Lonicera macranthoides]
MMDMAGNSVPLQTRVYADCMHVPIGVDDQVVRNGSKLRTILPSRTGELTISFEGQVHVFPAVAPEKVRAVLLLLGGCEIPRSISTSAFFLQDSNKNIGDVSKHLDLYPRTVSLVRFRRKKKDRCFEKKIRYSCRKELAQR